MFQAPSLPRKLKRFRLPLINLIMLIHADPLIQYPVTVSDGCWEIWKITSSETLEEHLIYLHLLLLESLESCFKSFGASQITLPRSATSPKPHDDIIWCSMQACHYQVCFLIRKDLDTMRHSKVDTLYQRRSLHHRFPTKLHQILAGERFLGNLYSHSFHVSYIFHRISWGFP